MAEEQKTPVSQEPGTPEVQGEVPVEQTAAAIGQAPAEQVAPAADQPSAAAVEQIALAAPAEQAAVSVSKKPSALQRVGGIVVMVLGVIGLLLCLGGLVGAWGIRSPLRNGVIAVTNRAEQALTRVNSGLTEVNSTLSYAQQSLTIIDQAAVMMGDKIEAGSPVVTFISNTIGADLFPKIQNATTTANSVAQSVVAFNTTLVTMNKLPGVNVPTLSEPMEKIGDTVGQAQTGVQDLRTQVAGMKAGVAQGAVGLVTSITSRVGNVVTRIQEPVQKYQTATTEAIAKVRQAQTDILRVIDIATIVLSLVFIVLGAGQVLLIRAGARMW